MTRLLAGTPYTDQTVLGVTRDQARALVRRVTQRVRRRIAASTFAALVLSCGLADAQGLEPTAVRVMITQGAATVAAYVVDIGTRAADGGVTYDAQMCGAESSDAVEANPTHVAFPHPSDALRWCQVPLAALPPGSGYRVRLQGLACAPYPAHLSAVADCQMDGAESEPFAVGLRPPAAPATMSGRAPR